MPHLQHWSYFCTKKKEKINPFIEAAACIVGFTVNVMFSIWHMGNVIQAKVYKLNRPFKYRFHAFEISHFQYIRLLTPKHF